ncbi:MAG TPA: hypothetical protein PLY41_04525, partial [Acetomicrobium sp.]|nr:hypothetical protein [Acetomicrobium sp.]
AFLHAQQNGPRSLDTIVNSPSLFPFRISPVSADQLTKAFGRLDAFSVGLDQDLITLKDCSQ